jgi:F-type H+-transporting ATPase subunit epsilon
MRLQVWVPSETIVETDVIKIKAEAENGWFCILPRHVDFVIALVPGILSFDSAVGKTEYVAIDQGVLVKCGPEVLVSTRGAVAGANLGVLRETVENKFRALHEREQASREFEAKLEADLVRGLVELEKHA